MSHKKSKYKNIHGKLQLNCLTESQRKNLIDHKDISIPNNIPYYTTDLENTSDTLIAKKNNNVLNKCRELSHIN